MLRSLLTQNLVQGLYILTGLGRTSDTPGKTVIWTETAGIASSVVRLPTEALVSKL